VSANPAGRPTAESRRLKAVAKMAELAEAYGGLDVLGPVEKELLLQAATVLLTRPTRAVDITRRANSVQRLLGRVAKMRGLDRGRVRSMTRFAP
jgi:hypothetical protein